MERIHENQRHQSSIREPSSMRSSRETAETTAPAAAEGSTEVFELRPLSRRQATARVQKRGPARFRFVTDGD